MQSIFSEFFNLISLMSFKPWSLLNEQRLFPFIGFCCQCRNLPKGDRCYWFALYQRTDLQKHILFFDVPTSLEVGRREQLYNFTQSEIVVIYPWYVIEELLMISVSLDGKYKLKPGSVVGSHQSSSWTATLLDVHTLDQVYLWLDLIAGNLELCKQCQDA